MALIGPVLRRHEKDSLLETARLIAACPSDTPDRIDEARVLLRRILREHALGAVSGELREQIVRTLSFAIDHEAVEMSTRAVPLTQERTPTGGQILDSDSTPQDGL